MDKTKRWVVVYGPAKGTMLFEASGWLLSDAESGDWFAYFDLGVLNAVVPDRHFDNLPDAKSKLKSLMDRDMSFAQKFISDRVEAISSLDEYNGEENTPSSLLNKLFGHDVN